MQISPLHAGETWIRKDVIITQNEKDLLCKMWNENADKEMKVGDNVKISNVIVGNFNQRTYVSSTIETKYEVCHTRVNTNN